LAFLDQAVTRLRTSGLKATLPYALGRFRLVRAIYSQQARLLRGHAELSANREAIFPGIDVAVAIRSLRRDAVFRSISLPPSYVVELKQFATTLPLKVVNGPSGFHYADVKEGCLADASIVPLAYVKDIDEIPLIKKIAEDPVAMAVMGGYLGYAPRYQARLYWSFVNEASLMQRRQASQTIEYHYDVEGFNFAYMSFYLTDCDRLSGAHVMVIGSHVDKPLKWLFGSARMDDKIVESHYSSDRLLLLEGRAGYGFLQDSSCLHKALPPSSAERLMLQIRYL